jgi:RimJ/RimL family protein N-acetyltransferase
VIFTALQPNMWSTIPDNARPRKCEDTKGIVAIDAGKIVAIAVFDSWTANSCMIHIWIENPLVLKHGFAEEVFEYIFGEESGREVVIGCTPANNEKALKFIKHIGFEEIGRIPDGFERGVDFVLTTMRKESCKWLKPRLRIVGGN